MHPSSLSVAKPPAPWSRPGSSSSRQQPCVLVVEDEHDLRSLIVESLEGGGFNVAEAPTSIEAQERLRGFAYDAIVVDLRLPDGDGMQVLDAALDRYPQIAAIVITGFGGVQEAVTAIRRGAKNFLLKPFQLSVLRAELSAFVNEPRLRTENAELRAQLRDRFSFDNIVGQSGAMQQIFQTLDLVAPMNSTVLIQGETGTGKELIARTIHHNSPRAGERFVAFNAAAIPETLAEAEMFGHMKGAFTGAIADRPGRFEAAHRGTLFIDEVALMPMSLQAKLLRALQEREVERVGGSKPIKFDARLVAATNCDLRKLVGEGKFREDLYYRLHVIPITLPPLRTRPEDVPLLARRFLVKSCEANGLAPKTLSQESLRCLMNYNWPGNIRQLENAIEHAVAMTANEPEVTLASLPPEVVTPPACAMVSPVAIPDEGISFTNLVEQLEKDLILKGLEKSRGNKRHAARLLGLSRTTLIDKIHRLELDNQAAPLAEVI